MGAAASMDRDGPQDGWHHTPEHLRINLQKSLKALRTDKVDMWYLHGPDRSVPFKETLEAVNQLHKEGFFRRFGISNYQAWEVAQMCEISEENGWIKPSVYQVSIATRLRNDPTLLMVHSGRI